MKILLKFITSTFAYCWLTSSLCSSSFHLVVHEAKSTVISFIEPTSTERMNKLKHILLYWSHSSDTSMETVTATATRFKTELSACHITENEISNTNVKDPQKLSSISFQNFREISNLTTKHRKFADPKLDQKSVRISRYFIPCLIDGPHLYGY